MKRELEDCLMKDFPKVYHKRCMTRRENCMPFGFECRDGWFDLIKQATESLNVEIMKFSPAEQRSYFVSRVYEKDGVLNIDMPNHTESMTMIIYTTRDRSQTICEECGKEGSCCQLGDFKSTFCENCFLEIMKKSKVIKDSKPIEKDKTPEF